jgi:hypothetical protein
VKRHVLEILGAIRLCLAAYLANAARVPISLPLIGMQSGMASSPDALAPELITIPKLRVRWPQFPNLCVGLCASEEYLQ